MKINLLLKYFILILLCIVNFPQHLINNLIFMYVLEKYDTQGSVFSNFQADIESLVMDIPTPTETQTGKLSHQKIQLLT